MVVAGEASGDLHGARMVAALRRRAPNCYFTGMGSHRLRDAEVELLFDSQQIAVMGLVEVLRYWPKIKRALSILEEAIVNNPPDLLILIDYVEFNLRIAAVAKRVGVKVLFYISPQIWAWRPERVHKIGRLVDMMAVIFPFEVAYYDHANIPVRYVGHPLIGHVSSACPAEEFKRQLSIPKDRKIIGLLPGSRVGEVKQILPVLLDMAQQLNRCRDDLHFVLPLASSLSPQLIEKYTSSAHLDNLTVLDQRAYDVMNVADSIAIASGTATLEAAIMRTPMAIVYKFNVITAFFIQRKMTIEHVGLPNIVMGRGIVPEFIQSRFNASAIAEEIEKQLDDQVYRQKMLDELAKVSEVLGEHAADERVAEMACEMLALPAV